MKRRFSIIGCQHAHIGSFIKEMLEMGHICAGIYEPENIKLANQIASQYNVPLVAERQQLLDDSVEIIGCAAINNEKIDVIEWCEKHGKHVMIDKPAVTDRQGLERLRAVIDRGAVQVGMLLTERFRPSIHTLKYFVQQGDLGDIVSIGMRKPHRLNPNHRPPWHFDKKKNGGIIIDLFIHDFDLLRWITGREVLSVEGILVKNILPEHPGFYDTSSLIVQMEGNVVGQFYADWHTPDKSWTWGDCRIFVTGTKGSVEIRLAGDPLVAHEELLLAVTNMEGLTRVEPLPIETNITQDFLNRIAGLPAIIEHQDILMATEASIIADETVKVVG
jgi:predicted dehydrogenase